LICSYHECDRWDSGAAPRGLGGLLDELILSIAQSTRSIGVDCAIDMAASRRRPTNKFVLTLLVVGETLGE